MLLHVKCHLNDVRLVNSAQTAFQCVTDRKCENMAIATEVLT